MSNVTTSSKDQVAVTAQSFTAPDSYQLTGDGISVSYLPVGAGGLAHLTYHDANRTMQFTGNNIRRVEVPDLGSVISVTLAETTDSGSTDFTFLLPGVNLPNQRGASATITTEGITTIHKFSLVPGLNYGQRETYKTTKLTGTALLVIIPL